MVGYCLIIIVLILYFTVNWLLVWLVLDVILVPVVRLSWTRF